MKPFLLLLVLSLTALGQEKLTDLSPSHQKALDVFLKVNPQLSFRADTVLSTEYRQVMRDAFGQNFKPNYAVGDFNKDGQADFAVLLNRKGNPVSIKGIKEGSEHSPSYPLTMVVFNGDGKGFAPAFEQATNGPRASFIYFGAILYFGIFETDADRFAVRPDGKKYKVVPLSR